MYDNYQKVESSPEEGLDSVSDLNVLPRRHRRPRATWALNILKHSCIALLSIWGLISIFMTILQRAPVLMGYRVTPAHHGCYCGTSSKEAIAMGCKYDSLAAAWLPEHCRDDELTEEFDHSGDGPNGTWLYWKDTHHTIPLAPEDLQWLGDTPGARFHMDYSWHEVHCLFYWRKEHRFRLNGKILDPRSDTEDHIKHCGEVWARKATYGMGTVSGVVFDTNTED